MNVLTRAAAPTTAWIAAIVAIAVAQVAGAQLRVVSYNVAAAKGDPNAMTAVFAAIAADDKFGFAVAPTSTNRLPTTRPK